MLVSLLISPAAFADSNYLYTLNTLAIPFLHKKIYFLMPNRYNR